MELVDCVLLDSVQSQANRMELALLEAWRRKEIPLPVITVDFSGNHLENEMRITSLEARTVSPMRFSGTATWARKDSESPTWVSDWIRSIPAMRLRSLVFAQLR